MRDSSNRCQRRLHPTSRISCQSDRIDQVAETRADIATHGLDDMVRQVPGEPYARITSSEANEILQKGGATVVDVRNEDEWKAGHVAGAIWIPVDDIIPRFDELPADGGLLFICEVGARSGLAAEYAAAMGADTSRLYNVEDGTGAWIAAGLPHEKGM